MGKGSLFNLGVGGLGGAGFVKVAIMNFTSWIFFDLLFTYRRKDVVWLVLLIAYLRAKV